MPANKYCLILAAGFGTRMGEIGKTLPKVMWPIFEKTLLELQVHFARKLGYQNIYINLFHQADEILDQSKNIPAFSNIKWLIEKPEILDIGGGIHNLASQPEVNYQGELLVLNADQFLWFNESDLNKWKKAAGDFDALLLTWGVNTNQGYNQITTDTDGRFLGVTQNVSLPRNTEIETYSGNSIINLSKLTPKPGKSAFFESVCHPSKRVMTAKIQATRYWDFGTAKRYWDSMFSILENILNQQMDEFLSFIMSAGALDQKKLRTSTKSYGTDLRNIVNLSGQEINGTAGPAIVLKCAANYSLQKNNVIIFNSVTQALS